LERNFAMTISSRSSYLRNAHDRRWVVFPLFKMLTEDGKPRCACPKGHRCAVGKHPRIKWTERTAPMPLQFLLNHAWDDWQPADEPTSGYPVGFGLHLGPSRIVVLDIDTKRDKDGDARLAELIAKHGDLPPTYTVETGSGGRHYYFTAPDWIDSAGGFGTVEDPLTAIQLHEAGGVELFAGTHYVVTPFSPHKNGNWYSVIDGRDPAPLPDWIAAAARAAVDSRRTRAAKTAATAAHVAGSMPAPDSQDAVIRRAVAYIDKIGPAIEGQGGSVVTSRVACTLVVGFDLPISEAMPLLQLWNASHAFPRWSDEELFRKLEWADDQGGTRGQLRDAQRPDSGGSRFTEFDAATVDRIANELFGDAPIPVSATANVAAVVAVPTAPVAAPPDPPPSAPPRCPSPRGVLMRSERKHASRLFWFDCKRLDCPHCGPRKRLHWQATVQCRLSHHGRTAATAATVADVHLFWCDRASWDSVSRSLRSHNANYYRLATDAHATQYLVISTVAPNSAAITGLQQLTTDQAAERLCMAIEMLPVLREKALSYSRPWKLIEEEKNSNWQGWTRVAKVEATQAVCWEIFECHKVDWKPISHSGQFWTWTAWQFTDQQCEVAGGYQRVYGSLTVGEVLPDIDHIWGDTPDEFATSATGPPGGGVWFDW
jgi:hypothetical protein